MPCKSYEDYGIFYLAAAFYGLGDCLVTTVTATICTTSFASTGQTAGRKSPLATKNLLEDTDGLRRPP